MRGSKWFRIVVIAAVALSVVGLLVGTLQVVGKDTGSATPEECRDGRSGTQACRQALMTRELDNAGSSALDGVDDATRVKVARALCEEGAALGESGAARPLRSEWFAKVAKEQKVSADAVAAVAAGLAPLCRSDAERIQGLPITGGTLSVKYEAFGSGPVTVEYTGADGKAVQDDAFVPWFLPVTIQNAGSLSMSVTPRKIDAKGVEPASDLGCSISIGTKVVARQEAKGQGDGVRCSASEQDVASAANAAPTTAAPAAGP